MAMFDTGSSAYFAISQDDLAGTQRTKGIGNTISGYGSPGSSLGGQAPEDDQLQVELKSLSIDTIKLGRVAAIQRELSPSLIGSGFLKHFVVTLDSQDGAAYFTKYADGPYAHPSFGFTLAFDKELAVATVWDDSPAQEAGLEAGLPITSINGQETDLTCEGIHRAIQATGADEIEVAWPDGTASLSRKSHILE